MEDLGGSTLVDLQNANGEQLEQRGRRRHRWGPIPGKEEKKPTPPTNGTEKAEEAAPPLKKRRRSRWDTSDDPAVPAVPGTGTGTTPGSTAVDDSRALMLFPGEIVLSNGIKVVMPPALTGRHPSGDPEVVELHKKLAEIDRKLRLGAIEIPPEHERSPSPPPVYDSNGVRLNTREVRVKEKISRERNAAIEELLKRDPTYQPPTDYKPERKFRKLYIPYKEFPEYNFIGLIIGPRGNTHKRMQQETNTVIAIRGKGSVKEGARGANYDYGDDDDLHVLVTGERQEDVDQAAVMVERLLRPMDEEMNQHKQKQLRELALINGTLKEENYCYLCGEGGHSQLDCPKKTMEVYHLPDAVQVAVDAQYARDLAKINPGEAHKADEEYQSFLAELGGTDPRAASTIAPGASGNIQRGAGGGGGGQYANEPDGVKLWIGNLPQSVDSQALRLLFEPFGVLTRAEVKTVDGVISRGFGFIHYEEEIQARTALEKLMGTVIEGKNIVIRTKDQQRQPGGGGDVRRRPGLGAGGGPNQPSPYQQQLRADDDIPPDCKLYVGNLPPQVDDILLKREFERFGPVLSVRLIFDRDTRQPKGYGFVAFADAPSAATAIAAMDGYTGFDPSWRPLAVRQAGDQGRGGRQQQYNSQQQQQHHHHQQQQGTGGNFGAYPPSSSSYNYGQQQQQQQQYYQQQHGGGMYPQQQQGGYDAAAAAAAYPSSHAYGATAAAATDAYAAYGVYPTADAYAAYGVYPTADAYAAYAAATTTAAATAVDTADDDGMMPPPPPPPLQTATATITVDEGEGDGMPPPPPPPPPLSGVNVMPPLPPPPPPPVAPEAVAAAAAVPAGGDAASEYEKFMSEMQAQLP